MAEAVDKHTTTKQQRHQEGANEQKSFCSSKKYMLNPQAGLMARFVCCFEVGTLNCDLSCGASTMRYYGACWWCSGSGSTCSRSRWDAFLFFRENEIKWMFLWVINVGCLARGRSTAILALRRATTSISSEQLFSLDPVTRESSAWDRSNIGNIKDKMIVKLSRSHHMSMWVSFKILAKTQSSQIRTKSAKCLKKTETFNYDSDEWRKSRDHLGRKAAPWQMIDMQKWQRRA